MKQKLVSIYMNSSYEGQPQYHHGSVEDLLANYLNDGWTIAQLTTLNVAGGGSSYQVSGWIVVLLQK